jgi:hypothetical protein
VTWGYAFLYCSTWLQLHEHIEHKYQLLQSIQDPRCSTMVCWHRMPSADLVIKSPCVGPILPPVVNQDSCCRLEGPSCPSFHCLVSIPTGMIITWHQPLLCTFIVQGRLLAPGFACLLAGFGLKVGWPGLPARCPKPCQSLTFMDSSPEMRKAMPPHNPSLASAQPILSLMGSLMASACVGVVSLGNDRAAPRTQPSREPLGRQTVNFIKF